MQLGLRRLRGKQTEPEEWKKAFAEWYAQVALRDEMLFATLGFLQPGARTKHVHYTHGRSAGHGRVQADNMTREKFWLHLEKVYAEAYPDPGSPTTSILAFGVVVQEMYEKKVPGFSSSHKHAPCFTTVPHYWGKVATISREKYGVYLNAVSHKCYTTMFRYVREPSAKKPLSALDAEPFFSKRDTFGTIGEIDF